MTTKVAPTPTEFPMPGLVTRGRWRAATTKVPAPSAPITGTSTRIGKENCSKAVTRSGARYTTCTTANNAMRNPSANAPAVTPTAISPSQ